MGAMGRLAELGQTPETSTLGQFATSASAAFSLSGNWFAADDDVMLSPIMMPDLA